MLRHENIVLLKDAFRRNGKLSLVFEFVDMNLLELLERNRSGLDQDLVCKIIYQLTKAIAYCHRNDVVHRDIKLENLLINKHDYSLKLCDFGFARTLPSRDTALTDYVATRWYRAPEILVGIVRYGKEVDVWAIACIAGEISDGQPLFPGQSELDQLHLIQKLIGPLTPEQLLFFQKNERYQGIKFPGFPKPEGLEMRYLGLVPKKAISFMKAILVMEPRLRLTADAACSHPWFEGRVKPGKIVMNLPRRTIGEVLELPAINSTGRWQGSSLRKAPVLTQPKRVLGGLELTGGRLVR